MLGPSLTPSPGPKNQKWAKQHPKFGQKNTPKIPQNGAFPGNVQSITMSIETKSQKVWSEIPDIQRNKQRKKQRKKVFWECSSTEVENKLLTSEKRTLTTKKNNQKRIVISLLFHSSLVFNFVLISRMYRASSVSKNSMLLVVFRSVHPPTENPKENHARKNL